MEPLDQTDRKILALLQTDGRLSGAEVGRRVGLSQPAASARILRLERQGIITGYHATVDPAAVGLTIHAVVRLRTTHVHLGAAPRSCCATTPINHSHHTTTPTTDASGRGSASGLTSPGVLGLSTYGSAGVGGLLVVGLCSLRPPYVGVRW
ncbi:Lrp/AsnC family transcriptional regulator [Curtobacterium sp. A7_M15]|uniref:Lrp/AsnC family transcriptional regulator n=1 Tax=Curtobacterium sp. A7_M15 TaxID=3065241 RepID=UPI002737C92E|nr:Lrp/AsnC family transcriptional regulator [Curtobacterium sp. A7_M15]MDP4332457.1 Lrp/AsnC family transcriptional regulator [Curtobacterium sp. A7_M15]